MEPTIQFADQTAPSAQNNAQNNASIHNAIGGVVRLRSRTQSIGRKGSIDYAKSGIYEEAEDEDAGLRNEGDYKHSQVCGVQPNAVYEVLWADQ
jgi:KUP system potassium uptake protein